MAFYGHIEAMVGHPIVDGPEKRDGHPFCITHGAKVLRKPSKMLLKPFPRALYMCLYDFIYVFLHDCYMVFYMYMNICIFFLSESNLGNLLMIT